MKTTIALCMACLVMMFSLSACNHMSRQDVGMVTGGVVGGVAGSALTRGSAAGTIVGAVGGGFIGRQLAR